MKSIDLSKADSDHLTVKYQETSIQIDELQKQLVAQRENASNLEQAIMEKQQLMKALSDEIVKRNNSSQLSNQII
jgi:septal ring factor EnvC (AmiA/AmiB activator)